MTSRHSIEVSVFISFFKTSSSTEKCVVVCAYNSRNDNWPKLAFLHADQLGYWSPNKTNVTQVKYHA